MGKPVSNVCEINRLIETERSEMYRLASLYGVNDERTVRQSQKLDILVVNTFKRAMDDTRNYKEGM